MYANICRAVHASEICKLQASDMKKHAKYAIAICICKYANICTPNFADVQIITRI